MIRRRFGKHITQSDRCKKWNSLKQLIKTIVYLKLTSYVKTFLFIPDLFMCCNDQYAAQKKQYYSTDDL
jgi:hypothetical protein